jgi:hypothetical protein
MGSRLPSEEEVLIIRPTGKKGCRSRFQPGDLSCPGVPARKAGISEQDPNASGPGGMQLLLRL